MRTNRMVAPLGKVIYYRPDGCGRDTYISGHSGGKLDNDRVRSLECEAYSR